MRLTGKGRYAVTAMLDIALHERTGPVPLAAVARRQAMSHTYLEQLSNKLRRAGLLASVRGAGGGYRLSRPQEQISVADILAAGGEQLDSTQCRGAENCLQGRRCLTHMLWHRINRQMTDFLGQISLAELVKDMKNDGREHHAAATGAE